MKETEIGNNCNISDLSVIAENNVVIGNNVTIQEFVTIRENTIIEDNAIIRVGSVIGGQGYEYKKDKNLFLVNHVGGVIIKEHADIHHNVCVDKAIYPWDDTIIGNDSKIDNLVHIAHGVKLGERVSVVANTCVAGRTVVGDDSWIGPVSAVRNGLVLGKESKVSMGSVVTRNVEEGQTVTGNFAIPHEDFIQKLKSDL